MMAGVRIDAELIDDFEGVLAAILDVDEGVVSSVPSSRRNASRSRRDRAASYTSGVTISSEPRQDCTRPRDEEGEPGDQANAKVAGTYQGGFTGGGGRLDFIIFGSRLHQTSTSCRRRR